MNRLENRTAIITGGGTGIGKGIARCFLAEGARVIIGQRRIEKAKQTAQELDPSGSRVLTYAVDIARSEEVAGLMDFACREWGRIDILVNNASVTGPASTAAFLDMELEHIDRMINTNLRGTILCSQLAGRVMKEQGKGVILHISSVGAFAAQENGAVYCATKSGMVGLARTMALELIEFGIRVNCIAPGDIRIEEHDDIYRKLQEAGVSGRYFRKIPAGRQGSVDEIGKAAVFLASDESSYVVGETLIVDGGFLIY